MKTANKDSEKTTLAYFPLYFEEIETWTPNGPKVVHYKYPTPEQGILVTI